MNCETTKGLGVDPFTIDRVLQRAAVVMSSTRSSRSSQRLERRRSIGPYAGSATGTGAGSTGLTYYMANTTLGFDEEAPAAAPSSGSTISRTLSKFSRKKKGTEQDGGTSEKRSSARSGTRGVKRQPTGERLIINLKRELSTGLGVHVASSTVASTVTVRCCFYDAALLTLPPTITMCLAIPAESPA